MNKYKKKQPVVLVTGAAKRIGKCLSEFLALNGFAIALHHNRSSEEANMIAKKINEDGGNCKLFQCDLSNEQAVQKLVPAVIKQFGTLDVLINNASVFKKSSLKSEPLTLFHEHLGVNFIAPYILSKCFVNKCKKGQIINILDTNIRRNRTEHGSYLLSKKALGSLTELLAIELAPNFRVNAIAPGFILPPVGASKADILKKKERIPLKRSGTPEDICQSVDFILNHSFLTGQIIFNDGGEQLL